MAEERTPYPRPQFERNAWMCLNGVWDFRFDEEAWQSINVPFAYQAKLSGIGDNRICDHVSYRRRFTIPASWAGQEVLLNFGAVDYECEVTINGHSVGRHTGGNTGFSFNITNALTGSEEEIIVTVFDPWNDETIPRGKQYWKENPEIIWYTRTTGIWQTVWLEPVNALRISSLRYTGDIDNGRIGIQWQLSNIPSDGWLEFDISLPDRHVATVRQQVLEKNGNTVIDLFGEHILRYSSHRNGWCWTPESPTLFNLNACLFDSDQCLDSVCSYFGLRKIEAKNGIVYLNNKPYYHRLVLDQGYWPDGLMTAPDDDALKEDIIKAKKMGFNGCRKHQKAEDPRFLYWADKLGYLVWSEIGSCVSFSVETVSRLMTEWKDAVLRDINHPSIVAWVTINESWGVPLIADNRQHQALAQALYYQCKALDPTRLVVGNDGWEIVKSDICAIHNYKHGDAKDHKAQERFAGSLQTRDALIHSMPSGRVIYADGSEYDGEPIMLTEFGGISLKCRNSCWGYTQVADADTFAAEYKRILEAIGQSEALCGFCYTQLCDVEQETNGLLTSERQYKVDPDVIRIINEQVRGFWSP